MRTSKNYKRKVIFQSLISHVIFNFFTVFNFQIFIPRIIVLRIIVDWKIKEKYRTQKEKDLY